MDKLFLDANVLFSAAYREQTGLLKFWSLADVVLTSSSYAREEAERNLSKSEQRKRLDSLMKQVKVHSEYDETLIPHGIKLRDKDRPILAAAIGIHADYLITGDVHDFGCFFGTKISNVMILPPSEYLAKKKVRKHNTNL